MGFGARRGKLDDAFAKLHRATGQQTDRRSETGAKRREHTMTECPRPWPWKCLGVHDVRDLLRLGLRGAARTIIRLSPVGLDQSTLAGALWPLRRGRFEASADTAEIAIPVDCCLETVYFWLLGCGI